MKEREEERLNEFFFKVYARIETDGINLKMCY